MNTTTLDFDHQVRGHPAPRPPGRRAAQQPPPGHARAVRRFGPGPEQLTAAPGRYLLLGDPSEADTRRLRVVLRLLGLAGEVPFVLLTPLGTADWRIDDQDGDLTRLFHTHSLGEHYLRSGLSGGPSSPALLDARTGTVVCDDADELGVEFETSWRARHAADAPDLFPDELRGELAWLARQIRTEVQETMATVVSATRRDAALGAKRSLEARLASYDDRLGVRRFLVGDGPTDADVRLFVLLSCYERGYRPGAAALFGERRVPHLQGFGHLWSYARDLFSLGFMDEREAYYLDLVPGSTGEYHGTGPRRWRHLLARTAETLVSWREPPGREWLP